MKIYIVERNNPYEWQEPEVFKDGSIAVEVVREEYERCKYNLGIEDDDADNGYGAGWAEWEIDEGCYYGGEALIDRDIDGDRWQWRITEHVI